MHICGFDFDVVNMEDDSFFSWGQVFNLRQGPKEQKNYGPHESWGGAQTAPRAPRLLLREQKSTNWPASADRTARHHVLPMGVGPFAFRYRRKRSYPCQYIDTTRKAMDCATTLLLTVFIKWNFAEDFSSFVVETVRKMTNLGIWSPFWGS